MPRKPLIPRDLLKLYPDWYARWGHNGAMMHLRGQMAMRPDYAPPWFRDHYDAIDARLIELENDDKEKEC